MAAQYLRAKTSEIKICTELHEPGQALKRKFNGIEEIDGKSQSLGDNGTQGQRR